MDEQNMQQQIDALNGKLDIILEEIEHQRRHRREMEDLKDDLMRVGHDLYKTAVEELEEIHDEVSTGDIAHLAKKLLRNVNHITATFEQLENVRDFVEDFAPVSRQLSLDMMARLHEMDRKGYFEFLREMSSMADNVVTSFTAEDVRNLGDNVVTILNTVKNLTQPDMLQAINNALNVYKKLDITVEGDVSMMKLVREMNSSEVRRGMAFMVQFLKNLANTTDAPAVTSLPE
ncbi:MAG: hypothetical protein C0600_01155 [Ignavibacteria bacterium]|nr:MAG: hypothetical protein C0600_01155 [Ignavibacteria bacterium]